MTFREGDGAYIIENNSRVTPVTIIERRGDFCTIAFGKTVISLRQSRLYRTRREAEANLPKWVIEEQEKRRQEERQKKYHGRKEYTPYDNINYRSPYGL